MARRQEMPATSNDLEDDRRTEDEDRVSASIRCPDTETDRDHQSAGNCLRDRMTYLDRISLKFEFLRTKFGDSGAKNAGEQMR